MNNPKKRSQWADAWRRLQKNKLAVCGLVIFTVLVLGALAAPLFLDYETDVTGINAQNRLQSPSSENWFGTDRLGRDVFARVVWGSRYSLSIGFSAAAISLLLGGTIGAIAGYYGGMIDHVFMRVMDILQAIPATLLAICIAAALDPSPRNIVIAIAVSFCPSFARVVRGPILSIREMEYVEAAKAIGAKNRTIIFSHIIPNCMGPIIVQTTLSVAIMILIVSGLSFLGLGIQPPTPEWGAMLAESRSHIRDHSYLAFFPGLAIMTTILSLNMLGDGLRDALDPRLK
ncbi:MAG: ABC transporter permease [Clostridiales bacterium]|jgi:peptide/nickel transport system permease protein|nr:ABC transporter permease [Clostridiales bacterium]